MESAAALYVHIPFCRAKCAYCDFFSVAHSELPDSFIDALIAELDFRVNSFFVKKWTSVYIGGGTPSLLSSHQIKRLLNAVRECACLAPHAEVTAEVNPESVTAEWLESAFAAGVNRISAGIQSFNNNCLQAVSRCGSKKDSLRLLTLLHTRLHPARGFSADLIAGLPGHSKKSFLNGLHTLVSYNPEHISLYTLTLEEKTPLYNAVNAGNARFSAEFADTLWLLGRDFLESSGYKQYEVSNFARVGFESEHNMTYWKGFPYIGIGPAACGTLFESRYTNPKNIPQWTHAALTGTCGIIEEKETLSKETRIFEFLFMGLRTLRGISASEFEKRFGTSLQKHVEPAFTRWKNRGLAHTYTVNGNDFYALTREGILFLNAFCTEIV